MGTTTSELLQLVLFASFILVLGIVDVEDYDNWYWFLNELKNMIPTPAFIISDRNRGIINSVSTLFDNVPHFFCFRHVMENFNLKFKNKKLKGLSWGIAKALTKSDQKKAENGFIDHQLALNWLKSVGYENSTILNSPVSRYGTVTSNNVESVNSIFAGLRKFPVVKMLIDIEKMVLTDRLKDLTESCNDQLTKYSSKFYREHLESRLSMTSTQSSESAFTVYDSKLEKFNVTKGSNCGCSCGFYKEYRFPCDHMFLVMEEEALLNSMCRTWKKENMMEACAAFAFEYILQT